MLAELVTFAVAQSAAGAAAAWVPRDVVIRGGQFINRRTGVAEVLNGTNVVMKGSPWIPEVAGTARCADDHSSCSTFNDADALYLKGLYGEHPSIRLGVIWAGGQPTPAAALDPAFVVRLRAFLRLCERHGIRVMLDVHQDAVGTAMCGEGVPMWFTKRRAQHHGLLFTLLNGPGVLGWPSLRRKSLLQLAQLTGDDARAQALPSSARQADHWAEEQRQGQLLHFGHGVVGTSRRRPALQSEEPVLPALERAGAPSWTGAPPVSSPTVFTDKADRVGLALGAVQGGWGVNIDVTDFSELQIEQLIGTAVGRAAYSGYIGLLAQAVADYPAAITIELMNEPPTIDEANLYRLCGRLAMEPFCPLISLSVSLSHCLSLSLCLSVSVCLAVCVSLSLARSLILSTPPPPPPPPPP
eukprot:SAG11_NODE_5246_length_1617_cov_3.216074_1_plen_411_part_10